MPGWRSRAWMQCRQGPDIAAICRSLSVQQVCDTRKDAAGRVQGRCQRRVPRLSVCTARVMRVQVQAHLLTESPALRAGFRPALWALEKEQFQCTAAHALRKAAALLGFKISKRQTAPGCWAHGPPGRHHLHAGLIF